MLIKKNKGWELKENSVTDERIYLNRRRFMQGSAALAATAGVGAFGVNAFTNDRQRVLNDLTYRASTFNLDEEVTSEKAVTHYNNYYEFGTGKSDPAKNAWRLTTSPWSVKVDGLVEKPATYAFEDLVDMNALEERIYRLRCVEAWSMVVPWIGVPLSSILKKVGVTSGAKYVAFETLANPREMPGVRSRVLNWPYVEGLRLDEAMNDLTFIAVGIFGKEIPNQNGAPLRLVVPWKYGFKSIKSIVRIKLTDKEPPTSWNRSAPSEYGFYSNVNPDVDHPRWSQSTERRIGDFGRRKTLPFNGYANEVASMYAGMDLKKNY